MNSGEDGDSWGFGYSFEMCWARTKFHAVHDWAWIVSAAAAVALVEHDAYLFERWVNGVRGAIKSYGGTSRELHEKSLELFKAAHAEI